MLSTALQNCINVHSLNALKVQLHNTELKAAVFYPHNLQQSATELNETYVWVATDEIAL